MTDLVELDSVEVLAIIDNELDPISPCPNAAVQQLGGLREISARVPISASDVRGAVGYELRMDNICCSAHGLSLMITGIKGDQRRTMLFDAGPEGDIWERNARRLRASIGEVEILQLSHWHRDHSGGILKALEMISVARKETKSNLPPVKVDLHPGRPDFRGLQPPGMPIVSLEADPTFEEIERAGGIVQNSDKAHKVLDNMFVVSGEIPRITEYEKGFKFGVRFDAGKGEWESDEKMADERLLMCKVKGKGVVVFTGCSHAGVVNASKYAVELGDRQPLYAVVGGFHLADAQPGLIQDTVNDLKLLGPKLLIAGHCTGWRAKFEMQTQMPGQFVPCFVGSKLVL